MPVIKYYWEGWMNGGTMHWELHMVLQLQHTSNLGFSVNAIVSMGRKAMERQGGKVSLNCIV